MKNNLKKFAAYSTVAGMITITAFVGHTENEVSKNKKAAQKVEEAVNSQCFETEWMVANLDMDQANGMNKADVLKLFRSSKTSIELESYYSFRNTVGYTYENTKRVWMNRKFHKNYSTCEKAANLFHELTHKLGFSHDMKATRRRPYSVPYTSGAIITKCCKD